MNDEVEENRDPYRGFVNISVEGVYTITDNNGDDRPMSGIKAMNIKNFGCIVVRWRGGKTYQESS